MIPLAQISQKIGRTCTSNGSYFEGTCAWSQELHLFSFFYISKRSETWIAAKWMHFCKMKSKAETMLWSAITLLALAMTAAQNSTSASAGDDGANDDDCAGGICDTTPYIQKLWATHGILMILGWVILIPTAITASLCRRFLPDALWFTIHTFLNWTAFFLIFLSFVIAVYIVSRFGSANLRFRSHPHDCLQNSHSLSFRNK